MSLTKKTDPNHFQGGSNITPGGKTEDGKDLASLLRELEGEGQVLSLNSAASAGGLATEALAVTGLLATDQVLAVAQKTPGANSLALLGWSTQIAGGLTGIWAADPGAGAVLQVVVKRVPLS